MNRFTITTVSSVIALALLATPKSVWAQQSGPDRPAPASSANPEAGSDGLVDIVVTAQKRSERLQDVPVAVTAVTGRALVEANITETKALSSAVPSLNFTTAAAFAQPFIRGVGSRGNTAFDEQIVPIYVDGIYQIGMTSGFFKLSNIERVEVLRGPQGTLFGRNAVGGAINIVTRDPGREASGEAVFGYGRFNQIRGELYASTPLNDTLAANISVMRQQDHGYARDVLTGDRSANSSTTSIRSKLVWRPDSPFQAKLTGYYIKTQDNTGVTSFPLDGNTAARRVDPTVVLGTGYRPSQSLHPYGKTKGYGTSLDMEYEAGGVTLTSLTALYYFRSQFYLDSDATASTAVSPLAQSSFVGTDKHTIFTHEVRAASNGDGPLKWLVGAFLFRDRLINPAGGYRSFGPGGLVQVDVSGKAVGRSFALFGEAEYKIIPQLSFKVGIRYSKDIRSAVTHDLISKAALSTGKRKWDDVSPRFTIDYEIAPRQRVYFTYSEAYKSGTILTPTFQASTGFYNIVDPEKLRSYEIGYKGDISRNFRANVAAFYYDYKNVQVVNSRTLPNGVVQSLVQNAAAERIYGVDADFTYAPTSDLTLGLSLAWLHARYAKFPSAVVNVRRPDGLGNMTVFQDVSGNRVQRAPDFTLGGNASYTLPTEVFGGRVRLSTNALYSSGWYFDAIETVGTGKYVDLNARVSWTSADEGYSLALWGSNLTNDHHVMAVSQSGSSNRASLVRPISYGAEVRFRF